jgi:auxin efflux carrier family protein
LRRSSISGWIIAGVVLVRYVILPLFGVVIVKGAVHLGLVHPDPLYQFVLLLQYAVPPAMNIGILLIINLLFIFFKEQKILFSYSVAC